MSSYRSPAMFLPRPLDVRYVVRSSEGQHGITTNVDPGELCIPLADARIAAPGWYSIVLSDDGATFEPATDDEITEARKHAQRLPVYDSATPSASEADGPVGA